MQESATRTRRGHADTGMLCDDSTRVVEGPHEIPVRGDEDAECVPRSRCENGHLLYPIVLLLLWGVFFSFLNLNEREKWPMTIAAGNGLVCNGRTSACAPSQPSTRSRAPFHYDHCSLNPFGRPTRRGGVKMRTMFELGCPRTMRDCNCGPGKKRRKKTSHM